MRGRTIMAVDDDEMILSLVEAVVADQDGIFVGANSGEACLALLESHKPRLILLDVGMANMDGVETLKKIRELYPKLNSKVAFLTAHKSLKLIDQSRELGADGFILKPTSPTRLRQRIDEILSNDGPDLITT